MIDEQFLASLSCPYCRSGFEVVVRSPPAPHPIEHGTVRCACYEYPIADGILVVRQTSSPSDAVDEAAMAIRTGDVERARTALVERASMAGRALRAHYGVVPQARRHAARVRDWLVAATRRSADGHESDALSPVHADLRRFRPSGFADYLFQRYANPSFIAAVPMMGLLENAREGQGRSAPAVLDLGCGTGHSTAMMRTLFPRIHYVAADPDFVNLLLLHRHFDREATCVCLDAEVPLPFSDSQFDAVFCLDAFHYIRSKWALVRELDRVIDSGGLWIFPHLHNADVVNPSPGQPLSATDYARIFGVLDVVLLDEAAVLQEFLSGHVLDASDAPRIDEVASAAAFSMFGSRPRAHSRRYEIGRRLVDADRALLGVNPIYEVTCLPKAVELRMSWPNPSLEAECAAIRAFLPERLDLDPDAWARITALTTEPRDEDLMARLIESFVLVPLPPGYRHLVAR